MKAWALVLFCLMASLSAQDQFTATLKSSASETSLDDAITLTLTLTYPKGYKPVSPDASRLVWQQIAFIQPTFKLVSEQSDPAVEVAKDSMQQWFQYVLEPWQEGTHRLGFGLITFENGKGETIYVLPNTVTVTVTVPSQIVLQPAKAMVVTRVPQLELDALNQQRLAEDTLEQATRNRQAAEKHTFPWHYLVGYIAILTLGTAGALLYWQSRRVKPVLTSPPQPASIALSKIAKLGKKLPKTPEEHDLFFVELSNAIRTYLEQITGIKAPEKTTPEFLEALTKSTQLQDQDQQLIAELLVQADMVKFAAQETTAELCQEALKAAKNVVARVKGMAKRT